MDTREAKLSCRQTRQASYKLKRTFGRSLQMLVERFEPLLAVDSDCILKLWSYCYLRLDKRNTINKGV